MFMKLVYGNFIDWTSPPIYDKYLDVDIFDSRKENLVIYLNETIINSLESLKG